MRRITFTLLMCACVVTQETNHRLVYYKFTRSDNGDYNLSFKTSNCIERTEIRRTLETGEHEVKGHYSFIAPNNQHVFVHYSPGIQGFKIWSPPALHHPMLPFKSTTRTQKLNQLSIKNAFKPSESESALPTYSKFDKLPIESTQDSQDYFKKIFKSKSQFEKESETPIMRLECTLLFPQDVGAGEPPVIVRFDIAPFGKGPSKLAESRKKISQHRSRSKNNNSKGLINSKTKLFMSAIGPRFEDD